MIQWGGGGVDWCDLQLEKLTKWQGQRNYEACVIATISIVQLQLPLLCVSPASTCNVCTGIYLSPHGRFRSTEYMQICKMMNDAERIGSKGAVENGRNMLG